MKLLFKKRQVTFLILPGTAVLVSILYLSYRKTQDLIEASRWIEHTQEVLIRSDQLSKAVKDIQVHGRVYLFTRDENFLSRIEQDEKSARIHLDTLRKLIIDNPSQIVRVDTLALLLRRHTNVGQLVLAAASDKYDDWLTRKLFIESKGYEDQFQRTIMEFQDEEHRLLKIRKQVSEDSVASFEMFLAGLVITLVLLIISILLTIRESERLKVKVTDDNINLEKTLKEVSAYRHALDESSIVAITDHHGIIKHVNDNFCRISKYSREELIGKDHRIINSGYHPKEYIKELWQTISSGNVWKGELRNRAKDGSIYWVDTSIVPFLNDHGKPYQYVAIRSEITDRKLSDEIRVANRRLEREVSEKQAELADVLEKMSDAFVMLDADLCYRYANKRFGELARKDTEKIIGKWIWDEFPDAVGTPSYNAINDAFNEQRNISQMDYYPPLDIWHQNNIYPTPKGLSIIIRDVTAEMRAERKLLESERLYRTIASSIPGCVILLIDRDLKYFLVEGNMLETFGYTKDELLGHKVQDVLTKERFEALEPNFERVFKGESFSMSFRRDQYDLLTRYVPLRDQHDQIYAAMLVALDITELKQAERKIADLNTSLEKKVAERTSQLEVANQELESFSYSVAHDLRAPLRGVAGYSNMLSEDYKDKLDDEGKRILDQIGHNAHRMGVLIDDLLTFSRLGRKEVRKAPVDMEALIEDVLREMPKGPATIRRRDIKPAYGDFSLIKHVVTNLLSNAVKYSSKKENPVVTIASWEEGGKIQYSINDNGVGFDMKYADKLFGVFQRLHSSEDFEGTGVGLAIVKRIIGRHGGEVRAEGKPDHGATFYFTLPAVPVEQVHERL
ncbi:MAG TPA: PAS domain S-box protein [Cyclobacteriaceae bacterium]|nr:PAS domain S-box protein [Cyclobacteriaceae bacterium]